MATVELREVSRQYGQVLAVDRASLQIADGEFITFVGPSGCGKTTLLNVVAGLLEPTGGDILIDGKVVNDVDPKDRDIAMVFQNYALYPLKDVYGNLAFPLRMRKMAQDEIDKRVKATADLLGLGGLLARKPRELSGGQQQRVALGRAIVRHPKVFLMDEPLSNLDAKLRVQMRTEIKRLQRSLGVTVIYVTHDQVEAMTMSDRLVVMNLGVVQQVGTPRELFHNPANQFVAGFLGSPAINLFPATLSTVDDRPAVVTEHVRLPLPEWAATQVPGVGARQVVAGFRPAGVTVSTHERPGAIQCELYEVEPTGDETYVYFRLAGQILVARIDGFAQMPDVTSVWVSFDLDGVHLFDAETGVSLLDRSQMVAQAAG